MPTPAVEDYLKAIYQLTEGDSAVGTSAIAERLGVAPGSVTGMLKRLRKQGLVQHERYQGARLTDPGRREAIRMIRRHRILELFMVEVLGYTWDQVHAEAHQDAVVTAPVGRGREELPQVVHRYRHGLSTRPSSTSDRSATTNVPAPLRHLPAPIPPARPTAPSRQSPASRARGVRPAPGRHHGLPPEGRVSAAPPVPSAAHRLDHAAVHVDPRVVVTVPLPGRRRPDRSHDVLVEHLG